MGKALKQEKMGEKKLKSREKTMRKVAEVEGERGALRVFFEFSLSLKKDVGDVVTRTCIFSSESLC